LNSSVKSIVMHESSMPQTKDGYYL